MAGLDTEMLAWMAMVGRAMALNHDLHADQLDSWWLGKRLEKCWDDNMNYWDAAEAIAKERGNAIRN